MDNELKEFEVLRVPSRTVVGDSDKLKYRDSRQHREARVAGREAATNLKNALRGGA